MFLTDVFKYQKTLRLSASTTSLIVAGVPVQMRRFRRLQANPASSSVAPKSVNLRTAKRLTVGTRTYTIAGVSTKVLRNRKINASPASMTVGTGGAVTLYKSRVAGFVKTDYTITGRAVTLKRSLKLTVNKASMTVTPRTVGMSRLLGTVSVTSRSFAIAAQQALLRAGRRLTLMNAAYTLAGQTQKLLRTYPISVGTRAYTITPQNTSLRMARKINVVKADWVFAQPSVELIYTQQNLVYVGFYPGPTGSQYTSYTYESVPYGDHQLIVVAIAAHAGTTANVSSVTIGGVSATRSIRPSSNQLTQAEIWRAEVGNSSGNIVVNYSVQRSGSDISVFALNGLASTTEVGTGQYGGSSSSPSVTSSFNALEGDIEIAVASHRAGTARSYTWGNVTELNEQPWSMSGSTNSAGAMVIPANATITESISLSGSVNAGALVVAYFR